MNMVYKTTHNYWFIVYNDNIMLQKSNYLPNNFEISTFTSKFVRQFSLGTYNNIEYYCAEVTNQDLSITGNAYFLPLRQAFLLLGDELYRLCIRAFSIINWDRNHQFCSRCGSHTYHKINSGFERVCSKCDLSFYPRISPSIIVLIKKGDHVLMARSPHFASNVFALIAGFVEVGETIEEAVHREVQEEVGLKIKNLTYFGSQPWPFPDSLMIAFTAEYASGEIVIDHNELEEANWYRYDNLPGRPSLPMSISSKLLDKYIDEQKSIERIPVAS